MGAKPWVRQQCKNGLGILRTNSPDNGPWKGR